MNLNHFAQEVTTFKLISEDFYFTHSGRGVY